MRTTHQMADYMRQERPRMVAEMVDMNRKLAAMPEADAERALKAWGSEQRTRWLMEASR